MRRSTTHPLQIAEISVGPRRIGITFLPGKSGLSQHGEAWDRDLATDIEAVRGWGADAVLTLVEDHELDMLQVPGLGEAVAAAGMAWHDFPIPDLTAPDGWTSLKTNQCVTSAAVDTPGPNRAATAPSD